MDRAEDAALNEPAPAGRVEEACEAALKLFLERGYDNTPMSLIAKELGLTKAGVYHHFESKEHLLYVIHKNTMERLLLPVIEKAEKVSDTEQRLRSFVLEYARLLTRDPSARILISEARRLAPEHFEEIRQVVMEKGRTTLPAESLDTMADRCEKQLRRVPDGTLRLANPHTYKVSISCGMNDLRNRLMKHYLSSP